MERSFRKTTLLTLKGWPWSISMDFCWFSRKGRYFLLETQEEKQSFSCNMRVTPFSKHGTRYLHWTCTSYLTTQNQFNNKKFLVPNAVRDAKPLFSVVQSKKQQWASCMDKQGSPFINSVQSDSDFMAQFVQVSKSTLYLKAEASRGVLKECPFVYVTHLLGARLLPPLKVILKMSVKVSTMPWYQSQYLLWHCPPDIKS